MKIGTMRAGKENKLSLREMADACECSETLIAYVRLLEERVAVLERGPVYPDPDFIDVCPGCGRNRENSLSGLRPDRCREEGVMGYDLLPNNREVESFHFGAFSWLVLLEAFGYLFPEVHRWGRYHCVKGLDERHDSGTLGSNDGFPVTDGEAKIMVRMARNFVAVQQSLPEQGEVDIFMPAALQSWPRKVRSDFTVLFETFAEWAERSGGFAIH